MANQKLPYVSAEMLRRQPDQFASLINQIIRRLNEE